VRFRALTSTSKKINPITDKGCNYFSFYLFFMVSVKNALTVPNLNFILKNNAFDKWKRT
jgi:hypothetical protein